MKEVDITVGVYYYKCFYEQPLFEHLGYTYGDCHESEKASCEVLSLQLHPLLTMGEHIVITDELIKRFV